MTCLAASRVETRSVDPRHRLGVPDALLRHPLIGGRDQCATLVAALELTQAAPGTPQVETEMIGRKPLDGAVELDHRSIDIAVSVRESGTDLVGRGPGPGWPHAGKRLGILLCDPEGSGRIR